MFPRQTGVFHNATAYHPHKIPTMLIAFRLRSDLGALPLRIHCFLVFRYHDHTLELAFKIILQYPYVMHDRIVLNLAQYGRHSEHNCPQECFLHNLLPQSIK